jgi:hypothetical protein
MGGLILRQKVNIPFQRPHVMLKSRPGGLPRLMYAKCSIWLRNSAWQVLGDQIKLGAGCRVLNPRRIQLFSQELQNTSVIGVEDISFSGKSIVLLRVSECKRKRHCQPV